MAMGIVDIHNGRSVDPGRFGDTLQCPPGIVRLLWVPVLRDGSG
jgi:hypothetical protein